MSISHLLQLISGVRRLLAELDNILEELYQELLKSSRKVEISKINSIEFIKKHSEFRGELRANIKKAIQIIGELDFYNESVIEMLASELRMKPKTVYALFNNSIKISPLKVHKMLIVNNIKFDLSKGITIKEICKRYMFSTRRKMNDIFFEIEKKSIKKFIISLS